jgi:hypothetical protein
MEVIIITVAILALVGYWIYTMSHPDQKDNDADDRLAGGPGKDPAKHPLAQFTKSSADSDKPWPYGEKLAEGKVHTNVIDYADIAIAQIKTPPVAKVTADNKAEAVTKAKKAPAKKTAAKPAVAKKAPTKKKSV